MDKPPEYKWPPPPLIRESSVDDKNPWQMIIRAHDHVWRDYSAAKILHKLSVVLAVEASERMKKRA